MLSHCPHCALKYEREQGYFIGAMYINYAATVAIAVPGYLLLDVFASLTINQQLVLWVPFAVIGVFAAVALWIFGRMAKRWSDMNA